MALYQVLGEYLRNRNPLFVSRLKTAVYYYVAEAADSTQVTEFAPAKYTLISHDCLPDAQHKTSN